MFMEKILRPRLAHGACHRSDQENPREIAAFDRVAACASSLGELSTYLRSRAASSRISYTL